jgi:hypothetical protein
MASKKNESQAVGLRWLLIHEMAHIIAAQIPEFKSRPVDNNPEIEENNFRSISWKRFGDIGLPEGVYASRFEKQMPFRPEIEFVRPGSNEVLFKEKDLTSIYGIFEKTNFPTLYAAANPSEDFADSFAAYVNIFIYKQPYAVNYVVSGQKKRVFQGCFVRKTCPEKISFFSKLLSKASHGD